MSVKEGGELKRKSQRKQKWKIIEDGERTMGKQRRRDSERESEREIERVRGRERERVREK